MSFPRPSSPLPDITAPAGPALAATTATTTTSPEWHRLSTPFALRLLGGTAVATVAGFALGVSRGGTMAGLRFRAENAHRQPRTMPGWYLYHKSKNYHVIYGGVTQGLRMAGRCGVWVGMFSVAEEAVDHLRRRKDCLSTVVAGLGTAGIFSLWSKSFFLPCLYLIYRSLLFPSFLLAFRVCTRKCQIGPRRSTDAESRAPQIASLSIRRSERRGRVSISGWATAWRKICWGWSEDIASATWTGSGTELAACSPPPTTMFRIEAPTTRGSKDENSSIHRGVTSINSPKDHSGKKPHPITPTPTAPWTHHVGG